MHIYEISIIYFFVIDEIIYVLDCDTHDIYECKKDSITKVSLSIDDSYRSMIFVNNMLHVNSCKYVYVFSIKKRISEI